MCVCVVCDTVLTCVLWGIMRTLSDEGALVKAAKELGVVFKARTPRSIIIEVVCTITTSLSLTHSFIVIFSGCIHRMEKRRNMNF